MGLSLPRTFSYWELSLPRTFYSPGPQFTTKKVFRTQFNYLNLEYDGCHRGLILGYRDRDIAT
jgi:hypothetical protein